MTEALSASESAAAVSTQRVPTSHARPSSTHLGAKMSHSCAPDCARLRNWRPTWAVMGPSTTASELAQAHLNGHIEEDQ